MCNVSHNTLLHVLRWWQVRAALRGYYRRERPLWETMRQHAFWVLSLFASDDTKPKSPNDLCTLPWDRNVTDIEATTMTQEEFDDLQRQMREENARLNATVPHVSP